MNLPPSPPDAAGPRVIALPPNGTTVAAEELHVHLVLASDAGVPVRINASAVESVGQAVLQLLLAAKADAEASGRTFAISNPSPPFRDRVERCGLGEALDLVREEEPA